MAVGLTQSDIDAIAATTWGESRGESREEQEAVVDVILNRMASPRFPNTALGVVMQSSQFDILTGPDRAVPPSLRGLTPQERLSALQSAMPDVRHNILSGWMGNRAQGLPAHVGLAVNYANPRTSDRHNLEGWIEPMQARARIGDPDHAEIGNHVFGIADPGTAPPPGYEISLDPAQPGLVTSVGRSLQEGVRGPDVADVQAALNAMGFDAGPVDGQFGPQTAEALAQAQQAIGRNPTGIATPQDVAAIGYELGNIGLDPMSPAPTVQANVPGLGQAGLADVVDPGLFSPEPAMGQRAQTGFTGIPGFDFESPGPVAPGRSLSPEAVFGAPALDPAMPTGFHGPVEPSPFAPSPAHSPAFDAIEQSFGPAVTDISHDMPNRGILGRGAAQALGMAPAGPLGMSMPGPLGMSQQAARELGMFDPSPSRGLAAQLGATGRDFDPDLDATMAHVSPDFDPAQHEVSALDVANIAGAGFGPDALDPTGFSPVHGPGTARSQPAFDFGRTAEARTGTFDDPGVGLGFGAMTDIGGMLEPMTAEQQEVASVQQALNELGFRGHTPDPQTGQPVDAGPLDVDGVPGPLTMGAIATFENSIGLEPTGQLTPELAATIRSEARLATDPRNPFHEGRIAVDIVQGPTTGLASMPSAPPSDFAAARALGAGMFAPADRTELSTREADRAQFDPGLAMGLETLSGFADTPTGFNQEPITLDRSTARADAMGAPDAIAQAGLAFAEPVDLGRGQAEAMGAPEATGTISLNAPGALGLGRSSALGLSPEAVGSLDAATPSALGRGRAEAPAGFDAPAQSSLSMTEPMDIQGEMAAGSPPNIDAPSGFALGMGGIGSQVDASGFMDPEAAVAAGQAQTAEPSVDWGGLASARHDIASTMDPAVGIPTAQTLSSMGLPTEPTTPAVTSTATAAPSTPSVAGMLGEPGFTPDVSAPTAPAAPGAPTAPGVSTAASDIEAAPSTPEAVIADAIAAGTFDPTSIEAQQAALTATAPSPAPAQPSTPSVAGVLDTPGFTPDVSAPAAPAITPQAPQAPQQAPQAPVQAPVAPPQQMAPTPAVSQPAPQTPQVAGVLNQPGFTPSMTPSGVGAGWDADQAFGQSFSPSGNFAVNQGERAAMATQAQGGTMSDQFGSFWGGMEANMPGTGWAAETATAQASHRAGKAQQEGGFAESADSGDDKVMCSYFWRLGWLPTPIRRAETVWAHRNVPERSRAAYRWWGKKLIRQMEKRPWLRTPVYRLMTEPWAYETACRMGKHDRPSLYGRMVVWAFLAANGLLGAVLGDEMLADEFYSAPMNRQRAS